MKNLLSIVLLSVLTHFAFAQARPAGNDSAVQYREMNAELTEKSELTTDKRHYEYIPIRMAKGDVALVIYESSDYIVALAVRDSAGREGLKEDDGMFFKTIGSTVTLPFKATEQGNYFFVFTSKEPGKTGKFKVKLFYYNKANDRISNSATFCEKLKYLTQYAYTGFEFIKGQERKGIISTFPPAFDLLPDARNEITHNIGDAYRSVYTATTDLDGLNKKFDELEKNIGNCVYGLNKKVYTLETAAEYEKKDFVRKVEFTSPGKHPQDINSNHLLSSITARIILKLEKSGTDKYQLKLDIQ
jgi:hypothetical protein